MAPPPHVPRVSAFAREFKGYAGGPLRASPLQGLCGGASKSTPPPCGMPRARLPNSGWCQVNLPHTLHNVMSVKFTARMATSYACTALVCV